MKIKTSELIGKPLKTWTVWTEQVNACMFDVRARTKEEATEKAYRVWKRDYANTRVTDVVLQPNAIGGRLTKGENP